MKHNILYQLRQLATEWWNFWNSNINAKGLQKTRVTFAVSVFFLYSVRLWNLDFYNSQSLIDRSQALELFDAYQKPLFSWNFWPDSLALVMQIVFLVIMVLMALGKVVRPMIAVAWVIHLGFMHRNWAAGMGVDTIVSVFLFYFSFCEFRSNKIQDSLTKIMIRMAQVHLSVIYFYTGIEKLRGSQWWDGTAIWTALSNPQMTSFDLLFLKDWPLVVGLMTHSTVLFELMFLPLVWNLRTRNFILILGVSFHLGTALLMDLWAFAAVMTSLYFLFSSQTSQSEPNQLSKI
jgi:hypothetical protein